MWRADTGLWERDPGAPVGFIGDATAVAFDPSDPQRGYVVGKQGFILRYDKTWTEEPLPQGFAGARFTSVAFAGREAIAVSDARSARQRRRRLEGRCRACGDLLGALGPDAGAQLTIAAGLPDGGAVIGGRDIVVERDRAGGAVALRRPAAPRADRRRRSRRARRGARSRDRRRPAAPAVAAARRSGRGRPEQPDADPAAVPAPGRRLRRCARRRPAGPTTSARPSAVRASIAR